MLRRIEGPCWGLAIASLICGLGVISQGARAADAGAVAVERGASGTAAAVAYGAPSWRTYRDGERRYRYWAWRSLSRYDGYEAPYALRRWGAPPRSWSGNRDRYRYGAPYAYRYDNGYASPRSRGEPWGPDWRYDGPRAFARYGGARSYYDRGRPRARWSW